MSGRRHRIARGARRTGVFGLAALTLVLTGFLVWANTPMVAERGPAAAVLQSTAVTVTDTPTSVVIAPTEAASGVGLVFIPGARVDPYAYLAPLAGTVEASGATVVITKPTLNLAFFDQRPLSTFTSAAPNVSTWYVGGHSLGGVRACMLVDSPDPKVSGLVLFASYCASSISDSGVPVLSISGSNDGLSTPAKITETSDLLPLDTRFVQIAGANHASFGAFGVQPGDGTATIPSDAVAQQITAELNAFLIATS
ncbi:hydrolase [Cryobacterium sp. MLB-32]|uniref:alpha/beta hydrolase n=1 Tax=Cryobacterium sp. MLB-32 TaxID=1529318 RepID=UPI0004E7748F|nr:alpha/beta hydrolase [Cryobacterium sp. MLB-32]KFF60184.1 hydrolase [Cryobacterium sp. MLB-32]